jgi:F-type H+-transporting ATPase subunit b
MHAKLAAETASKRHDLEADLNARLAAAEAQISEMKTRAMSNVGAIAREAAAQILQHLTGRPADVNAIARAQSEAGSTA